MRLISRDLLQFASITIHQLAAQLQHSPQKVLSHRSCPKEIAEQQAGMATYQC
jgi:hypothetical protein